jgi:hypothetical protein
MMGDLIADEAVSVGRPHSRANPIQENYNDA